MTIGQVESVLTITIAEAKELLAKFWTNVLTEDVQNTGEVVRSYMNGNDMAFRKIVRDVSEMSQKQIADLFGELNLGEELTYDNNVKKVIIEINNNGYHQAEVVWDFENLDPKTREEYCQQQQKKQQQVDTCLLPPLKVLQNGNG